MSADIPKTMKEIGDILLFAKNRDPSKLNSSEDNKIASDAYVAMSEIERKHYIELIPYLYEFSKDHDPFLRQRAISALGGFTAQEIPEARELALGMWQNKQEESDVRFSALGVWFGFYRNTRDQYALQLLYRLLLDSNECPDMRSRAYIGMLDIIDELPPNKATQIHMKFCVLTNPVEFNAAFDWDSVNSILKRYFPEALEMK